jgi:hypothetical protein
LTIHGPLEPDKSESNFICREANWELCQNYLANNLNSQCPEGNCSKSEIDVAIKHLTDTLNRATLYAVPLKRKTFKSMQIAVSTRVLIQKRNRPRSNGPLISSLKEKREQLSDTWKKTLKGWTPAT